MREARVELKGSRMETQSRKIRILIVDDHPTTCRGLADYFSGVEDFEVVGSAESCAAGLEMAMEHEPDLILLDYALPDAPGTQLADEVARRGLPAHILAYSAHEDDEKVQVMLAAGARGYIVKTEPGEKIVEAVYAVADGGTWFSHRIQDRLAGLESTKGLAKQLTEREQEVLEFIVDGLTNAQIAVALGITERTVRAHVGNILIKLGANNRAQAAAIRTAKKGGGRK